MADIFLSYAREDKAAAERLAQALGASWSVWWDRDIPPGDAWADVIQRELAGARVVLVLWSKHSRTANYVREEADEALDQKKLVPVCLDSDKPPFGFRQLQAASLDRWDGSLEFHGLHLLIKAIRDRIAGAPEAGGQRKSEAAVSPAMREPASQAATVLEAVLGRHASDPKARARAVDDYCREHGDPRFRADAWFLLDDPMLGFIEIPAGPFTMGSDKREDQEALDDEQHAHPVTLPAFFIARFPVTVAQFRAYVEDADITPGDPDCLRGLANHPVANVSWHEALAYCDWLARKLGEWAWTPDALAGVLRPTRKGDKAWRVTLASEAEWEKAARGTDGRIYPWDGLADPNKANYADTVIRRPSAVGCFPGGASPYGVEELSGNVWEWTRSRWGAYPYQPGQHRENLKAGEGEYRVARGGSFSDDGRRVRAACREGGRTDLRYPLIGFRVVVSPFSSDL